MKDAIAIFTRLMMTVPQKYAQNPVICRSSMNCVKSQRMMMLMTSENKPRVRTISGAEMNFNTGLRMPLKTAKTNPVSKSISQSPEKLKFLTK